MSQIFFSAWDSQVTPQPLITPMEPWVTDGTTAGTHQLKKIFAGPFNPNMGDEGSDPDQFTAGALMFFTANDGIHGRELWASDGTTAGTVMQAPTSLTVAVRGTDASGAPASTSTGVANWSATSPFAGVANRRHRLVMRTSAHRRVRTRSTPTRGGGVI